MAAETEETKFPGKDGMSRFMQIDMEHKEKLSYHGKGAMPRYVVPPAPESDSRFRPGIRTITEAQREVEVLCEADVVVVGGGPGGFAAAVCAARGGARTVLLERYGHLGGMSTGGLVNIIPNLSDIYGKQYIGGIVHELLERLRRQDAAFGPAPAEWGSTDENVLKYYMDSNFHHFFIRRNAEGKNCLLYSAVVDPEVTKNEINRMVGEVGVKLLLHSWVTDTIMDGDRVCGVIFESKSGRKAVLGKVVNDSTGDGDLQPPAGVASDDRIDPDCRITHLAFGFWIGGVDFRAYDRFVSADPQGYAALRSELYDRGLYMSFFRGMLRDQENVAWLHPHFKAKSQVDVEELTRMDVAAREKAVQTWELLKAKAPGFERSFIQITCPQLGTTGGRRMIGRHVLCEDDLRRTEPFEDTIAVFPNNDRGGECVRYSKIFVPYRSLLPVDVKGLMVACRAFSSDNPANNNFNLVPHCACFGQAAGTAAAIAVEKGIEVDAVPYPELKEKLLAQQVILPE